MISTEKSSAAPVGAGTADSTKSIDRVAERIAPYTYNYTSEQAFCQALLVQVIELADGVVNALEEADAVEAAQHAGMINGLAAALMEVVT